MSEKSAPECAPQSGPTEKHELFKPFAGTFSAVVRMWMGPGEPTEMTGTMLNTLDLGGLFLKQHYEGKGDEGPFGHFEGRGYWGYNSAKQCYEGFWIDTAADFFQLETGQVDDAGKTWEMKGEITSPGDGAVYVKRTVITLVDKDHHTMTMYFTGPDGNESKMMEIEYARA